MADRPNHSRTTTEENTHGADKIKTQGEIKTEVHKITPHKNNVLLARTIYNHVKPEKKSARNVQNADTSQRCAVRIK